MARWSAPVGGGGGGGFGGGLIGGGFGGVARSGLLAGRGRGHQRLGRGGIAHGLAWGWGRGGGGFCRRRRGWLGTGFRGWLGGLGHNVFQIGLCCRPCGFGGCAFGGGGPGGGCPGGGCLDGGCLDCGCLDCGCLGGRCLGGGFFGGGGLRSGGFGGGGFGGGGWCGLCCWFPLRRCPGGRGGWFGGWFRRWLSGGRGGFGAARPLGGLGRGCVAFGFRPLGTGHGANLSITAPGSSAATWNSRLMPSPRHARVIEPSGPQPPCHAPSHGIAPRRSDAFVPAMA